MTIQTIIDDCGISVSGIEPVHGGDINQAYCLRGQETNYFLKVNDAHRYPNMFAKEAAGLNALRDDSIITVPQVIKYGSAGQQEYLLLEWMETGRAKNDCWEKFGEALASMHQQVQPYFGWKEDNYIGSLPQRNTQQSSWAAFYSECRIIPLVKWLFDSGAFSKQDVATAETLCKKLEHLFPAEAPALLHGDLWSGNYMIAADGYACIFDPAVYYGHREMDFGMTKLFGGFDPRFYQAYHETYPLQKDWIKRLPLTQLYPLLVHAVLFGGHYIGNARGIMREF